MRITYHEEERGQYKNVYLDKLEPVEPAGSPEEDTDVQEAAWRTAVEAAPWLVGEPPFTGETVVDIIFKHLNEPVPSIHRQRPDVPPEIDAFMQRMGITNGLSPVLSLTLGSNDTTPLQMASAYATLAADGEHRAPYFVESIEDSHGKVVLKNESKPDRAISVQNARTVTQVLTQVASEGRPVEMPLWRFTEAANDFGATAFDAVGARSWAGWVHHIVTAIAPWSRRAGL